MTTDTAEQQTTDVAAQGAGEHEPLVVLCASSEAEADLVYARTIAPHAAVEDEGEEVVQQQQQHSSDDDDDGNDDVSEDDSEREEGEELGNRNEIKGTADSENDVTENDGLNETAFEDEDEDDDDDEDTSSEALSTTPATPISPSPEAEASSSSNDREEKKRQQQQKKTKKKKSKIKVVHIFEQFRALLRKHPPEEGKTLGEMSVKDKFIIIHLVRRISACNVANHKANSTSSLCAHFPVAVLPHTNGRGRRGQQVSGRCKGT